MDKIEQALAILDAYITSSGVAKYVKENDYAVISEAQTQLQALKQHLKEIEWIYKGGLVKRCPVCNMLQYETGHTPGCWLGEIAKEVGK